MKQHLNSWGALAFASAIALGAASVSAHPYDVGATDK